jgi:uncharacterized protein DUF4252
MKVRHMLAALALAAPLAMPLTAFAQAGRLQLPDFSGLAGKAKESVDISLDGSMLQTASQFMGGTEGGAAAKDALQGVEGIYIRVFEFDKPNVYSQADLAGVRHQLEAPGWKKLMSVQSKEEHVDMFMRDRGRNPADGGVAIVISEPSQFVIVNIVGNVDLEKLRQLQGKFGVPAMPSMGAGGASPPPAPSAPPAPPPPGPRT